MVRAYEESKAKGSIKFQSGPGALSSSQIMGSSGADSMIERDARHTVNHELDDLWQSIRNFLDDLNSKGDKREIAKGDKSNRLKFMEACNSFDYTDSGVISEKNIMTALSRARFRPLPSQQELSNLIKALEAYVKPDSDEVNYRKILEAPVSRESMSINGIFPKIVSFL